MKTSEKEKSRVTRIHQDVMNEIQESYQHNEEYNAEVNKRDYAADGIGKKPIVARHCDSRRRTHGVTNCSMTEAARRKARKEYASEA